MLREKLRNRKGFTLIEIIVVIVILAVLMAVAVPSVMSYMNEGNKAKYESVARTVLINTQTEFAKEVGDGKNKDDAISETQKSVAKKNYGEDVEVTVSNIDLTGTDDNEVSERDVKSVTCKITIGNKTKAGVKIETNKKVTIPDDTTTETSAPTTTNG